MALRAISQIFIGCTLLACASAKTDSGNAPEDSAIGAGAIVIRGDEVSGSALQMLRTRIPSARISTSGQCPRIIFRGDLSAVNRVDPSLYIDGTLMADTCVLNSLFSPEIDRIEVYPNGQSPYPELRYNPAGAVLIFRRKQ
jgi:hypothetical protein